MANTWWVGEEDLNEEQKKVIALPEDGSYFLMGPPGSGKTNLLLLRANYLHLAGKKNISIVVFTKTLNSFIETGGEQYSFPVEKLKTSMKWAQDFLYEYGVTTRPSTALSFKEKRAFLFSEVEKLIKERDLEDVFEALLLDEAQDYLPNEIEVFSKLSERLFAVADSRQKIYEGADPIPTIQGCVDETIVLKYHYRNGRNICKVADALAKDSTTYTPLLPSSNYDEKARPSTVDSVLCVDVDEQTRQMIAKLKVQLKAYPGEILGVLCPLKDDLLKVWPAIHAEFGDKATLEHGDDHATFTKETRICVCSVHAAKGLEFRAVHLAGTDGISKFPNNQRNMTFTGVTRTKTSLSIYHQGKMRPFIEKALGALQPRPETPTVSAAFGRRK